MKNVVQILKDFLDNNDESWLDGYSNEKDLVSERAMAMEILEWIKLEYKRELWRKEGRVISSSGLYLDSCYTWIPLLKNLVENNTLFSVFSIKDKYLIFNPETDKNIIRDLKYEAFEKYNPMVYSHQ